MIALPLCSLIRLRFIRLGKVLPLGWSEGCDSKGTTLRASPGRDVPQVVAIIVSEIQLEPQGSRRRRYCHGIPGRHLTDPGLVLRPRRP